MNISIEPIATIHTPYKQKFGIPRQPGLVTKAQGIIIFHPDYADPNLIAGIEQFSHLWLIFQFHQTIEQGWKPSVRPPRLGGNKKMGVLATRSSFRPNGLGMSVVALEKVTHKAGSSRLVVSGVDLVDATPILDIKPYIPYADALVDAEAGFAQQPPQVDMQVSFSQVATLQLNELRIDYPDLRALISQVLAQDPRPAYQAKNDSDRIYGLALYDLDIKWQVKENIVQVLEIITNPL